MGNYIAKKFKRQHTTTSNTAASRVSQSVDESKSSMLALKLLTPQVDAVSDALPLQLELYYEIDRNEKLTLMIGQSTSDERCKQWMQMNRNTDDCDQGGVHVQQRLKSFDDNILTERQVDGFMKLMIDVPNLNGFQIRLNRHSQFTDNEVAVISQHLRKMAQQSQLSYLLFTFEMNRRITNNTIKSMTESALAHKDSLTHLQVCIISSIKYNSSKISTLSPLSDSLHEFKNLTRLEITSVSNSQLDKGSVEALFVSLRRLPELRELAIKITEFKQLKECFHELTYSLRQLHNLLKLRLIFQFCGKFNVQEPFFESLLHLKNLVALQINFSENYYGTDQNSTQGLVQIFNQNHYLRTFDIEINFKISSSLNIFLKKVSAVFNKRQQSNKKCIMQFQLLNRSLNRRMRREVSWEVYRDFLLNSGTSETKKSNTAFKPGEIMTF